MKVVITSFGTRGDFEPFIALAEELVAHGHDPVFALPPFAVELFQEVDFKYVVIAPGMPDIRSEVNLFWSSQTDSYTSASKALDTLSHLTSYFPDIVDALTELCKGASVLVASPTQPLARIVHDLIGIPFVSVQFSHFGGNGGPALGEMGDRLVNVFRRDLGLGPIKLPFALGANSPQLALYAMSASLIGRPTEWPKHYHITGFFFRSRSSIPDRSLVEFLETGPPPVVVCLGSMPHDNPRELQELMIDAIHDCDSRAIIQGFPERQSENSANSPIYWADTIPHSYVFPRSVCIVFHGGAGTSAQTFRAGVPSVFIPHGEIYDQRYWAQLAQELGCSAGAIPYRDLTTDRLSSALRSCLDDPNLRSNARNLAVKLKRENGVERARRLIETLVRDIGLELPLEVTA